MAWNDNGSVDSEELLSILSMFPSGETQMDIDLIVSIDGSNIQGENLRTWGENTLSAYGYYFKTQVLPGNTLQGGVLWVARNLDVSSASLTSALKACTGSSKKTLSASLRVFKAGGTELIGIEAKPVIKFMLENARILLQSFITNNPTGLPTEVLAFAYSNITIETAPQLSSGNIGPVRTCQLHYGVQ
jgi:type VI protein secretion system component Hcp